MEIRAAEVRVIGSDGENIGVMPTGKAMEIAVAEGLDLVEIAPTAVPPVVRVISFDKFRYQKEKEQKGQRQSTAKDMKQIQIGAKSGMNDLLLRSRQIDEFLREGYKVEIQLKLRGREKGNLDWARKKFEEFLTLISEEYKITNPIKPGGRGLNAQIGKSAK
jgi:translation initiation factor IF-3